MHLSTRNLAFGITIVILLYYLFYLLFNGYPQAHPSWKTIPEHYHRNFTITPPTRKAKAVLLMHARSADLKQVMASMKQLEDTFNKKHQYPWLFLSEEPFSEQFKKYTTEITDSTVSYGLIPKEHWFQPDWIDEEKAREARVKLAQSSDALYPHSVTYRNLYRFNSGFFFRHELLKDYDYYWRVEPGVRFFCDLEYDPFLYMQDNNKVYGFTIVFPENKDTIPTLWNTIKEFVKLHPEYLAKDNALNFISHETNGETYNNCQFWSNFEIADLNFWRSKAYTDYFEHLDKTGGFYYERWSDAPIHTIAASLFAQKDQIHYFDDIGYRYMMIQNCPQGDTHAKGRCSCKFSPKMGFERYGCLPVFQRLFE
ncbi:glycosyltransferase family 15 protein [Sphaerobolus stellatus SS14]|nr:glycosyltransferase family 15 protein [Sphaerobolus stellatus SS14]